MLRTDEYIFPHFKLPSMKQAIRITLSIISIVLIISNYAQSQTYSVTFKVDMTAVNVSESGVHIAGNFQSEAGLGEDWDPSSTPLSDDNNDEIYEITVAIPEGNYEYKFVNGNDWSGGENPPGDCTVGSYNNREVSVYSNLDLPPVAFNECNAQLNFAVNMSNEEVSSEGIHVMGNFQEAAGFGENWNPASLRMQDLNEDGTYKLKLTVPPGNYQYVYVNGTTTSDVENPPDACTAETNEQGRVRTVNAEAGAESLPVYCFGTCDVCDPAFSTDYETYWWNESVFYEIFVRSFYDSDGDGIGDFQGIIEKLDYLNDGDSTTDSDLAINGIWLMPVNPSPSYHGYDITDYYAINPDYGSMADFEEFLEEAHKRGIKVIIDFVMNHTSDQIPWFTKSVNDEDGYRDWYLWRESGPGTGNWHYRNGAYYYGKFWSGMPDLNYNHTPVKEKMYDIAEFWLNKGVDGFRLDAIRHLFENSIGQENVEQTLAILEEFNDVYKTSSPNAFTVGEVWASTEEILPYVQNDRLDACFEFGLAGSVIEAVNNDNPGIITNQLDEIVGEYPKLQYSPFLSNHDQNRVFSQFGSDINKMKQAAAIYLTLPGVPFIYYGEEIGMTGTGAHPNIRRPMQWTGENYAGFSSVSPWNDVGSNYQTHNVEDMEQDSNSLLEFYKKLVRIRNYYNALPKGYYLDLSSSNSGILSYARIYKDNAAIIVSNFGEETSGFTLSMEKSSLEEGAYYITDLMSLESLGEFEIDNNGGFSGYQLMENLDKRDTRIFLISKSDISSVNEEYSNKLSMKIFPNPAKEYFSLDIDYSGNEKVTIEVYNLLGTQVYKTRGSKESTIPTSDWTPGIYLVKVTAGRYTGVERLFLVHNN